MVLATADINSIKIYEQGFLPISTKQLNCKQLGKSSRTNAYLSTVCAFAFVLAQFIKVKVVQYPYDGGDGHRRVTCFWGSRFSLSHRWDDYSYLLFITALSNWPAIKGKVQTEVNVGGIASSSLPWALKIQQCLLQKIARKQVVIELNGDVFQTNHLTAICGQMVLLTSNSKVIAVNDFCKPMSFNHTQLTIHSKMQRHLIKGLQINEFSYLLPLITHW